MTKYRIFEFDSYGIGLKITTKIYKKCSKSLSTSTRRAHLQRRLK